MTAAARADLDVIDPARAGRPSPDHDVVVNCAAYTAVDAAETDEATAFAVNAVGAANLARATARDGGGTAGPGLHRLRLRRGRRPAVRRRTRPVAPRSPTAAPRWPVSGRSGRTAPRVVGRAHRVALRRDRPELPTTMVRLERDRETVSVVDDQLGQPTWTRDLADGIAARSSTPTRRPAPTTPRAAARPRGTASPGRSSRSSALDPERVLPTTSDAFPRPAPRPAYSVLSPRRLGRRRSPAPAGLAGRVAPGRADGARALGRAVRRRPGDLP